MSKTVNFGVIGAGYMGKAYSIALNTVASVFPLSAKPVLSLLADEVPEVVEAKAKAYGFERRTTDWRALVADPTIDVVAVCTPTFLHEEMAKAAVAAGKHVICEKPLSLTARNAASMAAAAEAAGVKTMVGYCYAKNPAAQLAKEIIVAGEIGEVIHFRGTHNEDFLMDPEAPTSWRLKESLASRAGALGDLASHIINMAHYLCGPIAEVVADSQIVHKSRPDGKGGRATVENDDQTNLIVHFDNGALGSIEASRVAAGRKMGLTYEVVGTKGAIYFDQEAMAELQLYKGADPTNRCGFQRILVGPAHPDYGSFCLGTGHGIGYNDMITIEMRDMIEGVAGNRAVWPSFRDAVHTALVVDAALRSQAERRWVGLTELAAEMK
jgi:predicted dehydrogenase